MSRETPKPPKLAAPQPPIRSDDRITMEAVSAGVPAVDTASFTTPVLNLEFFAVTMAQGVRPTVWARDNLGRIWTHTSGDPEWKRYVTPALPRVDA